MGRFHRASTSRLCAVPLTIGVLLATPGLAVAQPESLASLVAAVANANQKLHELGTAIQTQQESVNKAIVDVQTARDNAAAAQQEVDASQRTRRGSQRRHCRGPAALRHLRCRNVCQWSVGVVSDRGRPRRHREHGRSRPDAVGQRAAGDHQSAAGPNRTDQSGISGAAGQAERRSSRRGRGRQPADGGVGADGSSADVQICAVRTGSVDRAARRRAGQARRGPHVVDAPPAPPDRPPPRRLRLRTRRPTGTAHPPRATRLPGIGRQVGIRPCPRYPARSSAAIRSRSSTRCWASRRPRRR